MITIPEGDTPATYARSLADDMATEGLVNLMDAEVSLRELQEMPLTPDEAADAARLRGLMLALQAGYVALAAQVAARLEASDTI